MDYFVFGLGDPPHPACTKFGGAPYRSRSIAWPKTGNGGNCEFIAQINFSQSRDLSSRLPSDLLLIFLTSEDGASTADYYFEWGQTEIADPILVSDLPELPFGAIQNLAFCEIHRTMEYLTNGYAKNDPIIDYGNLVVSKIGGISNYSGGRAPSLSGFHLFTLSTIWTSKGRPFPFLNQEQPIPKPDEPGMGDYMFTILMLGDIGEAYFFLEGDKINVETRSF